MLTPGYTHSFDNTLINTNLLHSVKMYDHSQLFFFDESHTFNTSLPCTRDTAGEQRS